MAAGRAQEISPAEKSVADKKTPSASKAAEINCNKRAEGLASKKRPQGLQTGAFPETRYYGEAF
jgi:hypothetical protein